MKKGKVQLLKIEDIKIDKKLYPRQSEHWVTVTSYAQALKSGAKFPPILVGVYNKKKYLVDGFHRLKAYRVCKEEYIQAEVKNYKERKDMFLDAVRLNAVHGRPFTFHEKVALVDRLERMRVNDKQISSILGLTLSKMKKFKAERITSTVTGEPIILKTPMKHLAFRGDLSEEEAEAHEKIGGYHSQMGMIQNFIDMVKNDMFNLEHNKVKNKLKELRIALNKYVK